MTERNIVASKLIVYWTTFHLLAFVLAGTGIKLFNASSHSEGSEFWPFVSIIESPTTEIRPVIDEGRTIIGFEEYERGTEFNGVFYQYGKAEFIFYLITGLSIFVLYFLDNLKEKGEEKGEGEGEEEEENLN